MSLLELKNLGAGYGNRALLERIDCSVAEGELFAVLGPNGAGKTTLVHTIAGLLPPVSGNVRVCGDDVSKLSPRALARRIACVFQVNDVTWSFSARAVVEMGRWAHRPTLFGGAGGKRRAGRGVADAVDAAMIATNCYSLRDREFSTLSGGEAQRVLLSRALAQEPSLLLLDEPVAHLDIHHQIATMDTIRGLASDSRSVMVTLHDANLALLYADRVALIGSDHRVEIGTPRELLSPERLAATYDVRVVSVPMTHGRPPLVIPVPEL